MELRDYIDIFKKQKKTFWAVVLIIVAVAVVWQESQPVTYQATLLLNVGRSGTQVTADYTYDSFYRLQADERFADTVVRWLGSPRVVEDIYAATNLDGATLGTRGLKTAFGARRLSSQVIEVTYTGKNTATLFALSQKVLLVLNRYTESLNKNTPEANWFVVLGGDPVIRDARISFSLAFAVGILLGVFIGFWATLLHHYLRDEK